MEADIQKLIKRQYEVVEKLRICTSKVDKYRHMFNEAPDLILLINGNDGKIVEANSASIQLTQYTPEELLGTHYSDLFVPLDYDFSDATPEDVKMYGHVVSSREIKRKDGTKFPVDLTINTFSSNNDKIIVTFIRDITERIEGEKILEETNQKLEEANATKDKFFTIIGHDIKNLFNVLIGFSDLLYTDYNDLSEDEKKFFIQRIQHISKNSNDLLENLLHWARSQSGNIEFKPANLNLSDTLSGTIELMSPQAEKKEITIKNQLSDDIVVKADKNMLVAIVRNLINNAIKYSDRKSNIIISAEVIKNETYISVTDFGVGIPENAINSLFVIDKKASREGTEQESGTGLGLILCKEFVERHDGEISVESEEGSGSTFTFTIPSKQI
ncbi:MAG: hypothetical protein SCALA702_11060 [Melioribacteraceae bacterium]|nr:MAG: hypothetical protein SCALA702_11060 [Melioribacteraceae bacterium]